MQIAKQTKQLAREVAKRMELDRDLVNGIIVEFVAALFASLDNMEDVRIKKIGTLWWRPARNNKHLRKPDGTPVVLKEQHYVLAFKPSRPLKSRPWKSTAQNLTPRKSSKLQLMERKKKKNATGVEPR